MHINVDLDTLLILAGLLTPANVSDTVVADQLLTGLERYVPPGPASSMCAPLRRAMARPSASPPMIDALSRIWRCGS